MSIHGNAMDVEVAVKHGHESFSLEFSAPAGKRLEVGEYAGAERNTAGGAATPGLWVAGNGAGCNTDYGRFSIKNIHVTRAGKVTRFWAVYEQHCEGTVGPAVFGEVRINQPAAATPEIAFPTAVQWPVTQAGSTTFPVPVTIVGGTPGSQVVSVGLQGADADEFKIAKDSCEGSSLSSGGRCELLVTGHPMLRGARTAQLVVEDASGAKTQVQLTVDADPLLAIDSAALVSTRGSYIGGGADHVFYAPRSLELRPESDGNNVEARAENAGENFSFDFAAPEGKALAVGEYTDAESFRANPDPLPRISVSGDGAGCSYEYGRFIVKDIHFNAFGRIDRFWALFEQHCSGPEAPPLFGEIRVGEPPPDAPEAAVPAAVSWPFTVVGARSPEVPVTVIGGESGAHVEAVGIQGEDAGDFRVVGDECQGAALAPGGTCGVRIVARPEAAGKLTAGLVITDSSGAQTTVQLSVESQPPLEPPMASNSVTLVSEPGDPIGGGQDLLIDAPEAVSISGEATGIDVQAVRASETYSFKLAPPAGKGLEVGEYAGAEGETPETGGRPRLSVSGGAGACPHSFGRFVIKDIHFGGAGKVERLWALYEQHCEALGEPALFGEIRVGEPPTEASETVSPLAIEWPARSVGSYAKGVPVAVGAGESGRGSPK